MEIKISLLFFFFIATTEVASQCPSEGKLTPYSQILKIQLKIKQTLLTVEQNILFSERCVPQSTCQQFQDAHERLGHA